MTPTISTLTIVKFTIAFETGLGNWFKRVFESMKPYGYHRAAIEMEREGYPKEAAALRQMAKFAGE